MLINFIQIVNGLINIVLLARRHGQGLESSDGFYGQELRFDTGLMFKEFNECSP